MSAAEKSTTAGFNEDGVPDLSWNLFDPLEAGDSGVDLGSSFRVLGGFLDSETGRFESNWYDTEEAGGGGQKDNHLYDDGLSVLGF